MASVVNLLKKFYWDIKSYNLRGLYYKFRFQGKGTRLRVGKGCRITNPQKIEVGNNVIIDDNVELLVTTVNEKHNHPLLILGDFVHLSKFNCIGCSGKVVLESHVRLAPYVHITDRNHCYDDILSPIWKQPISVKDVYIGSETGIGFGAQIMPGVHIGKHCVIAAGSIVTKNVPDYSVVGGNPAKIIKQNNIKTKKWELIKNTII